MAELPNRKNRAAGAAAADLAKVPVEVVAKVAEKAAAGGLNKSTTTEGGDPMPGFDRTGPMGAGPMTGGAKGRCNPAGAGAIPTYDRGYGYGRGRGLRRGFGGGFGPGAGLRRGYGRRCGWEWYPPVAAPVYPADAANEMDMLKAEADYLKKSLDAITTRIDALEKKPAEES